MSEPSLARYAREIERRWSEFLERPVVLSPKDWRWISDWHSRGIPLELIVDCLDEAAERRRRGRGAKNPRGLSYLAPALEESWAVILDGRIASRPPGDREPTGTPPAETLRRRIEREPGTSKLRALLTDLLARLESGVDPERVDAALDVGLLESIPAALREDTEAEARDWLRIHRSRLSGEQFENAVRRAVLLRLRRRLKLPRLGS